MPDYNPAIALGIQPPQQINVGQALSQASDYQRAQAATQLTQLNALQQARQYNALQAAAQAYQHQSDPVGAYMSAGGNPEGATQLQNLFAGQRAMAQTPGGIMPQAYEQLTGAARNRAETGKIGAETQGVNIGNAAKIAAPVIADPKDDGAWKTAVNAHYNAVGGSALEKQHVLGVTDPATRLKIAQQYSYQGVSPDEFNKPQPISATGGLISPAERAAQMAQPPTVPGVSTQSGQPQGSPVSGAGAPMPLGAAEFAKGGATQNLGDLKEVNEKYHNAAEVQSGLLQIQNNLDNVPQGGWYTTGTDAGKRVALAKGINTALQAGGLDAPFDKNAIASAEAAQKGTVKLGFDLARSLGSREAQMIVQQSIGVQPGMEMTEQGNRRIMTGLMTAAQRDKDYTQFFQSYAKQNPNMTPGEAQVAFNQAHPPSEYVGNVNKILSLPSAAVKDLRDNPKLAPMFDAKFGGGERLSRFVLGN